MKLRYIIIVLVVILVAVLGSIASSAGMDWYHASNLPALTPPDWLFGPAWTIIFILLATSAIILISKAKCGCSEKVICCLFLMNGLFNALWSWLFFKWHLVDLAIIDAALLALSVYLLIYFAWSKSKTAALLFLPYAVWVTFATYLTIAFWSLNS